MTIAADLISFLKDKYLSNPQLIYTWYEVPVFNLWNMNDMRAQSWFSE